MKVTVEVSLGELVDKLTILEIKSEKIKDSKKLEHIQNERAALSKSLDNLGLSSMGSFKEKLKGINLKLWGIEDDIRECERAKDFGQDFVSLARAVYITNDQRFDVKNEINQKFGSELNEVKSYEEY